MSIIISSDIHSTENFYFTTSCLPNYTHLIYGISSAALLMMCMT